MQIDILTLFPDMFKGPFDESIVGRAIKTGKVEINFHQLRNWAEDRHQTVDDRPFGGGVGMLLKIEPIYEALKDIRTKNKEQRTKVILLDAGGTKFTQAKARELSQLDHLVLICGRYEGVDHRVREHLIDEEISIGDYVLTGAEIPAMVIADSITRLLPGVLTKEEATELESFPTKMESGKWKMENLVEHPQYTRPADFNGWKVPEVLISGDHKKIEAWKKEQSLSRSQKRV